MYSKKEQLFKNKKDGITKDEMAYLSWFALQSLPCIVCGTYSNIQGHHIKERSTDKKDHFKLIPLCVEHHTGNKISPHGTPRLFREKYPIEAQKIIADKIYNYWLSEK